MFVSCLMATGLIIVERGVILRFQGFKRFGNFFFFMFVSCLIATGLIIMEVL